MHFEILSPLMDQHMGFSDRITSSCAWDGQLVASVTHLFQPYWHQQTTGSQIIPPCILSSHRNLCKYAVADLFFLTTTHTSANDAFPGCPKKWPLAHTMSSSWVKQVPVQAIFIFRKWWGAKSGEWDGINGIGPCVHMHWFSTYV